MGVKVRIHSSVSVHRGLTCGAFVKACAKQKMNNRWVSKHFCLLFNEALRWPDFHAVSAPSKLADWSRVTSPNDVAPKGLLVFWNEFDDFNGKSSVLNVKVQSLDELVNVVDDWRGFDKSVHTCDVNSFLIADWRGQLLHRFKEVHGECGAVFSARQPQDPRDISSLTVECS